MPSTPSSPPDAPDPDVFAADAGPRRRWLLALVALAVVAIVAGLAAFVIVGSEHDASTARPSAGGERCTVQVIQPTGADDAPRFRVPGLDGGCIDLADFRGRPVLLNFWASYCTPCREEFPLLAGANDRYGGDDGLAIIGVSHRDIDDDARAFADDQGADWLLGFDDTGDVATAYGVRPIPQTFFITRDGKISSHLYQAFTSRRQLERELRPILRADATRTPDSAT